MRNHQRLHATDVLIGHPRMFLNSRAATNPTVTGAGINAQKCDPGQSPTSSLTSPIGGVTPQTKIISQQ